MFEVQGQERWVYNQWFEVYAWVSGFIGDGSGVRFLRKIVIDSGFKGSKVQGSGYRI